MARFSMKMKISNEKEGKRWRKKQKHIMAQLKTAAKDKIMMRLFYANGNMWLNLLSDNLNGKHMPNGRAMLNGDPKK